jgi:hypothetical protein
LERNRHHPKFSTINHSTAFRLVATIEKAGAKEVKNFLNTGTFLKRSGKWQAAGWQATAVPKAPAPTPTP